LLHNLIFCGASPIQLPCPLLPNPIDSISHVLGAELSWHQAGILYQPKALNGCEEYFKRLWLRQLGPPQGFGLGFISILVSKEHQAYLIQTLLKLLIEYLL